MELTALVMAIHVSAALCVSGWMGWCLSHRLLADQTQLAACIEGAAPLKGRWLRLLIYSPALAAAVLLVFLAVVIPLLYAAMFVGTASISGEIAILVIVAFQRYIR